MPMTNHVSPLTSEEKLREALARMESALQLLDDANAPGEIGALVDLAICRLKDDISRSWPGVHQGSAIPPQQADGLSE